MLKKLFAYDFKAIGKTMWLFTALVVAITSVVCGVYLVCRDNVTAEIPDFIGFSLAMIVVFGVIISIYAVIGYFVLAAIMVLVRYYKNFFSDEGYLTFTLPVRTADLLNSKMISGIAWMGIAGVVEIMCLLALIIIVFYSGNVADFLEYNIYTGPGIFGGVGNLLFEGETTGVISWILTIVDAVVSLVFGVSVLYFCVTFSTIIAKKARVFLGIVLFSGICSTLSAIMFVVAICLSAFLYEEFNIFSYGELAYIYNGAKYALYGGVAVGAYFFNRYLLKNKLNLQ